MITVGIATMRRREANIEKVCRDLSPQADQIIVYGNDYLPMPEWVQYQGNVTWTSGPDLTDGGKFVGCLWGWDGYVLTCDDDLNYPENYVEKTVAAIDRYDRERIVSYHGGVLREPPIRSYYADGRSDKVHCLASSRHDIAVSIVGSGVAGWWGPTFAIKPDDCRLPCMADIWMAVQAQVQGIGMTALAHQQGWITHQELSTPTIWDIYVNNDDDQTRVINEHGPFKVY